MLALASLVPQPADSLVRVLHVPCCRYRETLLSVLEPFLQDPTIDFAKTAKQQRSSEVLKLLTR